MVMRYRFINIFIPQGSYILRSVQNQQHTHSCTRVTDKIPQIHYEGKHGIGGIIVHYLFLETIFLYGPSSHLLQEENLMVHLAGLVKLSIFLPTLYHLQEAQILMSPNSRGFVKICLAGTAAPFTSFDWGNAQGLSFNWKHSKRRPIKRSKCTWSILKYKHKFGIFYCFILNIFLSKKRGPHNCIHTPTLHAPCIFFVIKCLYSSNIQTNLCTSPSSNTNLLFEPLWLLVAFLSRWFQLESPQQKTLTTTKGLRLGDRSTILVQGWCQDSLVPRAPSYPGTSLQLWFKFIEAMGVPGRKGLNHVESGTCSGRSTFTVHNQWCKFHSWYIFFGVCKHAILSMETRQEQVHVIK